MYDDKGYSITSTYDRAVRSLELVEGYLGLNIKLHGEEDLLEKGQIFLFNHFARFETLIPPYIIYRQTKTYCRSVADHSLFEASPALANFLGEVGAVPNDLPGLLPFLAAEILIGRKVVIFPEGAIIKDRRVMNEAGELGIFSPRTQTFRKHHRGAAVLAMIVDIFKHRIRDLFATGDERRIGQWMDSLGFNSPEHLLEQARKPTVLVPGAITFYPIRASDNFLKKGAEFFALDKKLPPRLMEELAVEGNIVFRDTDMDIRLGEALMPSRKWRWWDTLLMRNYFLKIDKLDDFFSQKEVADNMAESMLMRTIVRESERLRDAYMKAIYAGITVNLGHLAATLICILMDRGERHVSSAVLHRALYLALKSLQSTVGVHLHRGLRVPDRYRDLPDGHNEDLERFLDTCVEAQLLEKTAEGYAFLDKLYAEHDFHQVRLENPLMVYANEAAPIKAVPEVLEEALAKSAAPLNPQEFGELLFDDELRAQAWNKAYYNKKRFQEINSLERASVEGKPYLLLNDQPGGTGVLLVHGLLSSPAELEAFGRKVHAEGHKVMGVRLAGHATSPWDLHKRRWEQWLQSVQRGYRILSLYCDRIIVLGFSTGAALSLILAAGKPEKLAGVISVAAPYQLQNRHVAFAPLLHGVNVVMDKFSASASGSLFRRNETQFPDINYRSIPISALHELLEAIAAMKKRLAEVECPVVIIQGDEDTVVKPESATHILEGLDNSPAKELHWIAGGAHGLIYNNIGETHALLLTSIRALSENRPQDQIPRIAQEKAPT